MYIIPNYTLQNTFKKNNSVHSMRQRNATNSDKFVFKHSNCHYQHSVKFVINVYNKLIQTTQSKDIENHR